MDLYGRINLGDGMIFEMPSCGGCKTCEIACSYHHRGDFNPAISSIKVLARKDKSGFDIFIVNKDSGGLPKCDSCEGQEEPLCMQFCKEKEKLEEMIARAVQK